jgi:hypothetical protein
VHQAACNFNHFLRSTFLANQWNHFNPHYELTINLSIYDIIIFSSFSIQNLTEINHGKDTLLRVVYTHIPLLHSDGLEEARVYSDEKPSFKVFLKHPLASKFQRKFPWLTFGIGRGGRKGAKRGELG